MGMSRVKINLNAKQYGFLFFESEDGNFMIESDEIGMGQDQDDIRSAADDILTDELLEVDFDFDEIEIHRTDVYDFRVTVFNGSEILGRGTLHIM